MENKYEKLCDNAAALDDSALDEVAGGLKLSAGAGGADDGVSKATGRTASKVVHRAAKRVSDKCKVNTNEKALREYVKTSVKGAVKASEKCAD